MFKPNSLYYTDGYKVGHKRMLAEGTTKLYGTWIPRSVKYAPKGITKILSFGQQLTWKWIHDEFEEYFFKLPKAQALNFSKDLSLYLGQEYDGKHFESLYDLGYLPIKVKSLPEGIETLPNIPHMTFVNTINGFAWLTLYLETVISSLAWKPTTAATIALQYRRNATKWVMKTDPNNAWLIDYMCHDFSARGLNPHDMISVGLGHASSHRGSDTLITIPASRYFYGEPMNEVCINSVNASEHSVSTTKIFTVGEKQMIIDWLKEFPTGILSIVADTFDLWKLLVEYIADPEVKALIMARDGKLVIRPDSGNPVDIICGYNIFNVTEDEYSSEEIFENGYNAINANGYVINKSDKKISLPEQKGVVEILADIFGTTTNEQGYKVLDSHIGCIYGDSITLDRQIDIYEILSAKGFASTNIVLGVGSYTYQYNTRDTFGFAAKGAWFEVEELNSNNEVVTKVYDIYKDPITDDGTKKSLKGLLKVFLNENGEYEVKTQCTPEEEAQGLLQVIYENGKFHNQITLTEIRDRIKYNII